MDEEQQEKTIAELTARVGREKAKACRFVQLCGYLLSLVHLYFAISQSRDPWALKHQRVFDSIMQVDSVVLGEVGSGLSLFVATYSFVQFVNASSANTAHWKNMLTLSMTFCVFQFIFWVTGIWNASQYHRFGDLSSAIWKPLVPPIWFAAVVILIDGISKMEIELGNLKASRYRLKQA